MELKVGARLRSAVDGAEFVVVRAPADAVELTCGGHPLLGKDASTDENASIVSGHDGGTVLGKRYAGPEGGVELLCTKPGAGALFCDGVAVPLKAAKPLPASD